MEKNKLNKIWYILSLGLVLTIVPVMIYWVIFLDLALNEVMIRAWGIYGPIVFFLFGFIVGIKFDLRLMLSDKTGLEK